MAWGQQIVAAETPGGEAAWQIALVRGDKTVRQFRLEEHLHPAGPGWRAVLRAPDSEPAGRLVLEMEPVRETIDGVAWEGFRYRYVIPGDAVAGAEIEETVRWRLAATGRDPSWWIRSVYLATEYTPGTSPAFSTGAGNLLHGRFGKIIPFDFHEGEGSALLVYPEKAALILNRTEARAGETPAVTDRFLLTPDNRATVWKRVLVARKWPTSRLERINRFNRLWLALTDRYREEAGLPPLAPPVPCLVVGPRFELAEALLPRIRELGFGAISVGPIWKSSATEGGKRASMSVYDFSVAERWGGIEGLRALCRKAAEYDIKVVSWFPSFHLSDESPLLAAHPEWKAMSARSDLYDDKLVPLDLSSPELRAYLRQQLKPVREAGVSGFWLDSFHNFGVEVVRRRDANGGGNGRQPVFPWFLETVRELQDTGFDLYAEALTPFGISSFGMIGGRLPFFRKSEYRALVMSPYVDEVQGGSKMEGVDYFSLLAFGTPVLLSNHLWPQRAGIWAFTLEQQTNLKRWHAQYGKALPGMKRLHGLVEGGKAVLWKSDDDAGILFALEDIPLSTGSGTGIINLDTGAELSSADPVLLSAGTIYRLEKNAMARLAGAR
ncbi:hypothetical protein OPIT5_27650 [Opitutaceae bacterium TAV5]|nr:hypothetical protein OPIT5_27650 [Opitutaceae bacterium TAV5]